MKKPASRDLPLLILILAAMAALTGLREKSRPPILFASRNLVVARAPGVTAGQGPLGRALAPGGALFVLDPDGSVRPFFRDGNRFFDMCDPTVSFDGARVVFAAATSAEGGFRLYSAGADGSNLRAVTGERRADATAPEDGADPSARHFDDLDPCWLPDGRILFASTRLGMEDQQSGAVATNLHVVRCDGTGLHRITSDRNGAEEPAVDPSSGHVVYSRWWFNAYRAGISVPVTMDPGQATPGDRVNLWQPVTITPDGHALKLAAGNPMNRAEQMLYQVTVARDGAVFGINAASAALFPRPGSSRLAAFDAPIGLMRALTPAGRAASPMFLDESRILFSWAAGDGDLDLCIIDRRGGRVRRLLERTGTDELDAVLLAPRPLPPVLDPIFPAPLRPGAKTDDSVLHNGIETFRFDCLNIFANGDVDVPIPNAPPLDEELSIRFYAVLSRPGSPSGDSLVLVREAPVTRTGAVHEHDLPADVPMFEQIVDRNGRILRTAGGPAHVPGYNYARIGSGTKCVGCHSGHSTLPVPINYDRATWINAAPSATVEASSSSEGTGPAALVDRRAAGSVLSTGWIARGRDGEWVRLNWRFPIEARSVIVYPASIALREGTDLVIDELEVVLLRKGLEVGRSFLGSPLDAKGSRIEWPPTIIDAVELKPRRISGQVRGLSVVALAEIEVTARLVE